MKNYITYFYLSCWFLLFVGCEQIKTNRSDDNLFVGVWQMEGRSMFEGMQVAISKKENGSFEGRILRLNENKMIQLFADSNQIIVSDIKRNTNSQFTFTEKKIAGDLFSNYGLETKTDYKAVFITNDLIGLSSGTLDPKVSKIVYRRVK